LAATAGKFGTAKNNTRLCSYNRETTVNGTLYVDDYSRYNNNYNISIHATRINCKKSKYIYRRYTRNYKNSIHLGGINSISLVKKSNKEKAMNEKKYNIYGIGSKMFVTYCNVKYCNLNSLVGVKPVQQSGKVRVHGQYGLCTVSIRKQFATREDGPKSVCKRRNTPKFNARVAEHLNRKKCIYVLSKTERNVEGIVANKSNISWGRMYMVIGGRRGVSILVGKGSREMTTVVCKAVGIVSVTVKMDQKDAAEQDVEMENDQQLESTHGRNCPRLNEPIVIVKTNVSLKHAISNSYLCASCYICASVRILYIYPYCYTIVRLCASCYICASMRLPYIYPHCYIIGTSLAHIPTLSVAKTTLTVRSLGSLPVNRYRLKYVHICALPILGKWLSTKTMPNRISNNNNTYNELGCNCNGRYGE
jgi:hypothetical protein